nr:hypothetical protein asmbl_31 [uncultured bacterium]
MNRTRTVAPATEASLVDVLDRVLTCGAVVTGEVVIALAGVDLIRLDLRLLLASVETAARERSPQPWRE